MGIRTVAWPLILLGVGLTSHADAASLRISPIGVDMPSTQRAASLSITNSDADSVSLQIRIFTWTQVRGEDVLTPATDIIASPPAITIPSGGTYTIRVARPIATPILGELAYRLFLDELPKPVDPRTVSKGVTMVLRTSMPVFVADKKAIAKLNWRAWQDKDGVHAQAVNSGQRHVRLSSMSLKTASGQTVSFGGGLTGYVLAGSTKIFTVKPEVAKGVPPIALTSGSSVTLTAKTDALDLNEQVVVRPN